MPMADRLDSTGRRRSASILAPRCLRLYHAAPRDLVPGFLAAGIAPDDVALTPTIAFSAVWLTSDARACAELQRLDLTPRERAILGFDPAARLRASAAPAVTLAVSVPPADRRLVRWAEWGPRHLPPLLFDALCRFGAVRARAWFLWRGPIPAAWIVPVAATPATAAFSVHPAAVAAAAA